MRYGLSMAKELSLNSSPKTKADFEKQFCLSFTSYPHLLMNMNMNERYVAARQRSFQSSPSSFHIFFHYSFLSITQWYNDFPSCTVNPHPLSPTSSQPFYINPCPNSKPPHTFNKGPPQTSSSTLFSLAHHSCIPSLLPFFHGPTATKCILIPFLFHPYLRNQSIKNQSIQNRSSKPSKPIHQILINQPPTITTHNVLLVPLAKPLPSA